jgi:hypothetical protein
LLWRSLYMMIPVPSYGIVAVASCPPRNVRSHDANPTYRVSIFRQQCRNGQPRLH